MKRTIPKRGPKYRIKTHGCRLRNEMNVKKEKCTKGLNIYTMEIEPTEERKPKINCLFPISP